MKIIDATYFSRIEEEINKFHKVLLNTKECDLWKNEHNGECNGCSSLFGCLKIETLIFLEKAKIMSLSECDYFSFYDEVIQEKEIENLREINREIREIINFRNYIPGFPAFEDKFVIEFIEDDEEEILYRNKPSFWNKFAKVVKIIKFVGKIFIKRVF